MSENAENNSLQKIVSRKLSQFLKQSEDYELHDLYATVITEVEKPLIELVLERSRGNQLEAARILGINRNTLRKKIRLLGIKTKRTRANI